MMLQMPGAPVKVKADLSGLTADTDYELVLYTLGDTRESCGSLGEEFNPLIPKAQETFGHWHRG